MGRVAGFVGYTGSGLGIDGLNDLWAIVELF